jgi:hypothetical protein
MVATTPMVTRRSSLTAILAVEAATAGAPTMGLTGELGAVATAAAEATRTATSPVPHVAPSTPARKSKNYDARRPPRQVTTTASPPSLRDFATYFSRRNSNLWDHQVRREARSSAVAQMLRPFHRERWGNNDTKCLYFPLSGSSSAHMARVPQEVLDRQVGPAEGTVQQQLAWT